MILSQRKTLSILRSFSILVPPYTYVTKKDEIHAVVSKLEPNKVYVLSSEAEVVNAPYLEVEEVIAKLLCSSEEVMVREQVDVIFECSLEIYVSNECKMFLKISFKNRQYEEEILNKKLWDFQIERAVCAVGVPKESGSNFLKMVHAAFASFCSYDAVRLCIDPIVFTKSKMLLAIRAQMLLDDCSSFLHKEFFPDVSSPKYPIVIKEAGEGIVCIGNTQPMVLALVDVLSTHGVHSSMAIDVGTEMDENSIGKAFEIASKQNQQQKVLIYFFTGLTNAYNIARGVKGQLSKVGSVGIYLEGTNVSGAAYVLHTEREQCALLRSLSSVVAWAKEG